MRHIIMTDGSEHAVDFFGDADDTLHISLPQWRDLVSCISFFSGYDGHMTLGYRDVLGEKHVLLEYSGYTRLIEARLWGSGVLVILGRAEHEG